nr:hypothetical protein [Tanacetum cinerariifolium]
MSDLAFRKRFRPSYKSSPSSSPPDLPSQKRYQGTSKLVEDDDKEDDDEEEDDEEEDEEIKKSLDSNSESRDAEDESPTVEDEDPVAGDEGLATGDEGLDMRAESLSLGEDKVVREGQQRAAPVVEAAMGTRLGMGYEALRRQEIALGEGRMPSVFELVQGSRTIIEPKKLERVSTLRQPHTHYMDRSKGCTIYRFFTYFITMAPLSVPSPVASPTMAETEGFLTELGARVEMQGGLIHDHTIAEERPTRLDLAEIVDSMRRGQEPKGDV